MLFRRRDASRTGSTHGRDHDGRGVLWGRSRSSGEQVTNQLATLRTIFFVASLVGFFLIVLFSILAQSWGHFFSFIGLSALVAGAAAGVGALLGFLFGIPRSLETPTVTASSSVGGAPPGGTVNPSPGAGAGGGGAGGASGGAPQDAAGGGAGTATSTTGTAGSTSGQVTQASVATTNAPVQDLSDYRPNTNLEQISDWLTKILVGVGLTQLEDIPGALKSLSQTASAGMGAPATPVFALALMLFFVLVGFLLSYLWTRIYLPRLFRWADDESIASVVRNVVNPQITRMMETTEQVRKTTTEGLMQIASVANVGGSRAPIAPSSSETPLSSVPAVDATQAPAAAAVASTDPNKGQFGGSSEANGRQLRATVSRIPGVFNLFRVELSVCSTDPSKPLAGNVTFFLHPTFQKDRYVIPVGPDGVAKLTVTAWGAFTVGAESDDGATSLELDLATADGAPEEFRAR